MDSGTETSDVSLAEMAGWVPGLFSGAGTSEVSEVAEAWTSMTGLFPGAGTSEVSEVAEAWTSMTGLFSGAGMVEMPVLPVVAAAVVTGSDVLDSGTETSEISVVPVPG